MPAATPLGEVEEIAELLLCSEPQQHLPVTASKFGKAAPALELL